MHCVGYVWPVHSLRLNVRKPECHVHTGWSVGIIPSRSFLERGFSRLNTTVSLTCSMMASISFRTLSYGYRSNVHPNLATVLPFQRSLTKSSGFADREEWYRRLSISMQTFASGMTTSNR